MQKYPPRAVQQAFDGVKIAYKLSGKNADGPFHDWIIPLAKLKRGAAWDVFLLVAEVCDSKYCDFDALPEKQRDALKAAEVATHAAVLLTTHPSYREIIPTWDLEDDGHVGPMPEYFATDEPQHCALAG